MTRLVLALLLVAPCASMKMKAGIPEKLENSMPNCIKVRYNQMSTYNTKSCYVYHSFMGYHPQTGQVQKSPDLYGFSEETFLLTGVHATAAWKWAKQYSSWASSFVAEVADGSNVGPNTDYNCNKRTSNGGVVPGYIDTCPHGPLWQAYKNFNDTNDRVAEIREEIKHTKKEIDRTRKVMKIMAKGAIPDLKGNLTETKEAYARIKELVKEAKAAKSGDGDGADGAK